TAVASRTVLMDSSNHAGRSRGPPSVSANTVNAEGGRNSEEAASPARVAFGRLPGCVLCLLCLRFLIFRPRETGDIPPIVDGRRSGGRRTAQNTPIAGS